MTVQESFAVLCDIHQTGGIMGHDSPHDDHVRPCRACANVRAGFLAVHVAACTDSRRPSDDEDRYATTEHCGDGWYCAMAEDIRRLGQQGG